MGFRGGNKRIEELEAEIRRLEAEVERLLYVESVVLGPEGIHPLEIEAEQLRAEVKHRSDNERIG